MVEVLNAEALRAVVNKLVDERLAERSRGEREHPARNLDEEIGYGQIYVDYGYSQSTVTIWVRNGWLERLGSPRKARYRRGDVERCIREHARCGTRKGKQASAEETADEILRKKH